MCVGILGTCNRKQVAVFATDREVNNTVDDSHWQLADSWRRRATA